TYKLMLFRRGQGVLNLADKRFSCNAGSVVFLPPGISYSFESEEDVEIQNYYFLVTKEKIPERDFVLFDKYQPENAVSVTDFADAPCLSSPMVLSSPNVASFLKEFLQPREGMFYVDFASSVLHSALYMIAEESRISAQKENPRYLEVSKILELLYSRISSPDAIKSVAAEVGYHPGYLSALISSVTGVSAKDHVTRFRIAEAKAKLTTTDLSQSELAQKLGFFDYSHFYKCFRAAVGMSPAEYRKKYGDN
ncbi:MAG: AraC family transcriptional regulator, partial [Clostridia bacterium]|nr:AraC family transcriptional regulator [Clostridia bacterium]